MQSATRPQAWYRERLLASLAALGPRSTLEIGCGGGAFLRAASAQALAIEGIDPDPSAIDELRRGGLPARVGRAEALPYADRSFDAAVFSYTAHHLGDWGRSLAEAQRVARHVLILDPWYDGRIASQAVAEAFDRWCKRIDRESGMVHHDCVDAGALLAPLAGRLRAYEVQIEYLLRLHELGPAHLRATGEEQLRAASEPERWRDALAGLVRRAEADGFSDDGAIVVVLRARQDG
ncbi:class I SAM-dependent methyltransferase [Sorangium sp. So ce1128]